MSKIAGIYWDDTAAAPDITIPLRGSTNQRILYQEDIQKCLQQS